MWDGIQGLIVFLCLYVCEVKGIVCRYFDYVIVRAFMFVCILFICIFYVYIYRCFVYAYKDTCKYLCLRCVCVSMGTHMNMLLAFCLSFSYILLFFLPSLFSLHFLGCLLALACSLCVKSKRFPHRERLWPDRKKMTIQILFCNPFLPHICIFRGTSWPKYSFGKYMSSFFASNDFVFLCYKNFIYIFTFSCERPSFLTK